MVNIRWLKSNSISLLQTWGLVKHLSNETNNRVRWFIKGDLQIPRSESDTADSKTLIIIYDFPVQSSYPQNAPSG